MKKSLTLAQQNGCASIAIPAVSSGIFGFPLQLCAETIAKSVRDHCEGSHRSSLTKIHLVNNDDKTVQAMTQAVSEAFAERQLQILSQRRSSSKIEQRRHTKEGLKIVLSKGNIEDVSTKVIVNTISQDLDLSQGAVSKAILQAAGHELQSAIRQKARRGMAEYGDVLHTPGFHLGSEVLHTVCPPWDNGTGQAQQVWPAVQASCQQGQTSL
ncbi:hypothetical protein AAFF_G00302720 [Aldrovandia affinis]|uniref:Macro domain-containing protein n=1 Tax=Aldrovandia affinis TaxID=143900 RepID=A0AAD7R8K1_9TELE|nr:hypothetical protein AAFF_G00302720 [Aldrovandia affinis]